MRLEKTIDHGSTLVRVHEPTVGQIRNLLLLEGLSFDPMGFMASRSEIPVEVLELVSDLSSEKLKELTLSEFGEVLEGEREMLRPFFSIMDQPHGGGRASARIQAERFDALFCDLIRLGYQRPWEYGWSFLSTALAVEARRAKELSASQP